MPPLTRLGSKILDQSDPANDADDANSNASLAESIQMEMIEIDRCNKKSKPKRQRRAPRQTPVRTVKVPRERFNSVYKSLTAGRPVLTTPVQSESKRTCNRFILSELDCYYAMQDGIHPESTTRLVAEMRNSLQKGDWVSLAKYITIFAEMARDKKRWYPTLLRYCMIALTEDRLVADTGLLESFLEGVIGCHSEEEKTEFLSAISDLPSNIHAAKYSELWDIPDAEENLSHTALQRLNDSLAKHCDDDEDSGHGQLSGRSNRSFDRTKDEDDDD